ncbi:NBR1-Ig-like domain-containing protein [Nonomuraea angiospora]|uniref:NBR1-Ig-like domain-containing protein n=1 Tax=Nonomuraea angiospora TaxID=46172 RepID=UPI0029A5E5F2|nr:NBR1-Ig-like domain-containing protein [Nonomuraea angiospora]MDX3111332.1 NBR1-Ig-like domain-containing protein [Nonomuraea angiospora]
MDDRRARAEIIEDFAATLRELRNAVGNPPFREMSGRSGAISHTTLHEATKGNRLPSWETTVEFVKVCNADPAAYRERWERANRAVRSTSAGDPSTSAELAASATGAAELRTVRRTLGSSAPRSAGEISASVPTPPPPFDEFAGDVQPLLPAQGSRGGLRLARPAAFAAVGVVLGATALVVAVVNRGSTPGGHTPNPTGSPSAAALTPADCPVRSTNPPWAPPLYKGDAAVFIEDVTLNDCTRVRPGKTMTKVWRLKNTGTVPWKGYSLRRLDLTQQADQCQTIADVPIKDTLPGQTVDIQTDITTARKPGLCYVRFKMVDASGAVVFPGSRPINFQIIVDGL